ncbi:oligosaccharyl transferase glycoprotein complex, beta subunit [Maudiozyma exigua]|uniref:Dolichyl-diphosphooligosaccharide--protein glycosyltransferase subunit WBP1 n=1 Tax=Maudiozyma exigua TaxID=34358 RepID=A0A9P6W9C9_MAUEX|nr:oligosaccharyl transferase glycoprotein complex, beta subunit [Kazachstania exigua]
MLGLRYIQCFLLLLCSIIVNVHAKSAIGSRTLIVFDDRVDDLSNYSNFFNLLKDHEFDITTLELSDKSTKINLFEKDTRLYDNLILFPVKGKLYSKQLAAKKLIHFNEDGGNILALTIPKVSSDPIHLYLNQLGIYPSPRTQSLKDLFQDSNNNNLQFTAKESIENKIIYSNENAEDSIYNFGDSVSAALLDNREQIIPLLKASRTSFTSGNKTREINWTDGTQGYLIAGFQNLVNARSLWLGSVQFLSNEHFKQNLDLINDLIQWNFQEKNIIKVTNVNHYHTESNLSYDELPYKVTDNITYTISLSQWDGSKWIPFITDDLQFELRQVDPYYRITMKPQGVSPIDPQAELYSTGDFKLPNRHGMFTFLTNYQRSGLSFIHQSDVKAIRHLANDEYPRSFEIPNAWVYLASIATVIISFIAFVLFFIATPASVSEGVTTAKKTN